MGKSKDILGNKYYWGRVEFAVGRGQIHLHILGIAKNKAYLNESCRAETEQEKRYVVEKYAQRMLDLTAEIEVKKTAEVRQKEQGDIVTAWSKFWGMFGQGHRSSLISTRLHASLM